MLIEDRTFVCIGLRKKKKCSTKSRVWCSWRVLCAFRRARRGISWPGACHCQEALEWRRCCRTGSNSLAPTRPWRACRRTSTCSLLARADELDIWAWADSSRWIDSPLWRRTTSRHREATPSTSRRLPGPTRRDRRMRLCLVSPKI